MRFDERGEDRRELADEMSESERFRLRTMIADGEGDWDF